jgi:NAD(P)-dependent dehydrogenase (short-subunit alcohol dehydrogenase family)
MVTPEESSLEHGPARPAAIVTGGSRGIGLAIAEALGEDGFSVTITARRPEALAEAAAGLRARGVEVEHVVANLAHGDAVAAVVEAHRRRFGRLDVLVNNAGVGIGATATDHEPKFIGMQIAVNLTAPILFYKHGLELLRAAAAERGSALVVNVASLAGVLPSPWLSVYSATKAALIAYTRAMNKELSGDGVKSVALCPGFVDTDMTEYIRTEVAQDQMLRPSDVAQAVRFVLRLSPGCVVPEIVLGRAAAEGV